METNNRHRYAGKLTLQFSCEAKATAGRQRTVERKPANVFVKLTGNRRQPHSRQDLPDDEQKLHWPVTPGERV